MFSLYFEINFGFGAKTFMAAKKDILAIVVITLEGDFYYERLFGKGLIILYFVNESFGCFDFIAIFRLFGVFFSICPTTINT